MKKYMSVILAVSLAFSLIACGKDDHVSKSEIPGKENKALEVSPERIVVNYSLNTSAKELSDEEKANIMNEYEFAKTDDYISNSELRNHLGDDLITSFSNLATTYVDKIYDVNAINISANQEAYVSAMDKVLSDNCIVGTTGENFKNEWAQAVIDSGVVMSADFSTGKDYVYADDNEIYVRGILNLKIESAEDISKIQNLLPIDVEVGKEYNFLYDIGFVALGSDESESVPVDNGKIDYILALAEL